VTDPLFWLVLSLLFVTISLTIVLAVAIPALRELARAARSAEKLFDTLRREFPPTLQSIRLTGMEISDLTDDLSDGVQSAANVVKQVDQSLGTVRKQAQKAQSGTRSVVAGFRAAWKSFTRSHPPSTQRRSPDLLPTGRTDLDLGEASDQTLRERPSVRRPSSELAPRSSDSPPPTRQAFIDEFTNGNAPVSPPVDESFQRPEIGSSAIATSRNHAAHPVSSESESGQPDDARKND
jgi:hypothetical protein